MPGGRHERVRGERRQIGEQPGVEPRAEEFLKGSGARARRAERNRADETAAGRRLQPGERRTEQRGRQEFPAADGSTSD
jgi:hypothetical protein